MSSSVNSAWLPASLHAWWEKLPVPLFILFVLREVTQRSACCLVPNNFFCDSCTTVFSV